MFKKKIRFFSRHSLHKSPASCLRIQLLCFSQDGWPVCFVQLGQQPRVGRGLEPGLGSCEMPPSPPRAWFPSGAPSEEPQEAHVGAAPARIKDEDWGGGGGYFSYIH